jgi:Holliday junction resolvase RusA-like endonuclease
MTEVKFSSWVWHALGKPVAQGSMRGFAHKTTKAIIVTDAKKSLKPWRQTMTAAALGAGPCLQGPVAVRLVFTVPRSKSATKTDLVPYRATGDLDKECRAALDAVVDAGLLGNDAQVADFHRLAKVYAFGHRHVDIDALPVPGVVMAACEIIPGGNAQGELWSLMCQELEKVWAKADPESNLEDALAAIGQARRLL